MNRGPSGAGSAFKLTHNRASRTSWLTYTLASPIGSVEGMFLTAALVRSRAGDAARPGAARARLVLRAFAAALALAVLSALVPGPASAQGPECLGVKAAKVGPSHP